MTSLTPEDRRKLELAGLIKPAEPTTKHQPSGRFLKDLRTRAGKCPTCGEPATAGKYCDQHGGIYARLLKARRAWK